MSAAPEYAGGQHRSSHALAARELWKFCWSRGSGSHVLFVSRTFELWLAEGEQVNWWQEAEPARHR